MAVWYSSKDFKNCNMYLKNPSNIVFREMLIAINISTMRASLQWESDREHLLPFYFLLARPFKVWDRSVIHCWKWSLLFTDNRQTRRRRKGKGRMWRRISLSKKSNVGRINPTEASFPSACHMAFKNSTSKGIPDLFSMGQVRLW